ncbi:LRR-GTPase of the ROCO family, putative pseudogene (Partial), partial [Ectocarpus siliculosus]
MCSAETDREVLLHFFRSTGGESWTHQEGWAENADDLGSWYGVMSNAEGRVVKLELHGEKDDFDIPTGNNVTGGIPPELGGLGALEELNLGGNNLSGGIPPELGRLGALEELNLGVNKLSGAIPSQLGQLGAVKQLDLSYNGLTGGIPPELGRLGALEELDLRGNKLSRAIPPELGGLGALQDLDVRNNKLLALGEARHALQWLTRLSKCRIKLNGNPWIMPPEGVVEKGLPEVMAYLRDVRRAEEAGAEVKTLKLLKVVLVGSSQAGKTSLVNSIVEGRGFPTVGTPAEVSTVGIELLRHNLKGTTVEFYDCAGQVDYYGLHQTFLTRRALYLLVWDVSRCHGKTDDDLDEVVSQDIMRWLYALDLRAPGSTVILVANKCDGSIEGFSGTAAIVEKRVTVLRKEWLKGRGFSGTRMETDITVLRIANGDGVFLDVVWLSTALKPILSHKLLHKVFPQDLAGMRDELVHNGILRLKFAEHLWSDVMKKPIPEEVLDALCRVIVNLGVALPLEPASLLPDSTTAYATGRPNISRQDMLVIMRLPETCGTEHELQELISYQMRRHSDREVTLMWRFDGAGPPYGLVERVIASCHAVGVVEMGLCWRYGAVFQSRAMATSDGSDSLYTFVIRYDYAVGDERRILMFGPLQDDRVWKALRWVASSVVNISKDWPGVLWEGWPQCARCRRNRIYFAKIGNFLLVDAAPGATPHGCGCLAVKGTVPRLVLERLGTVVNTQQVLFLDIIIIIGKPIDESCQGVQWTEAVCAGCRETFSVLEPSAGRAAGWCWGAFLAFLGAGVTLKEVDATGWKICLGLMGLCLIGAGAATLVACRFRIRTAREENARRTRG